MSLERQITKYANLAITYLNSRGVHQFYTNFLNANLAGQPPPAQLFYQFQSGAIFKQNQLIVNSSVRKGNLSLFGYYTLNYANSDTSGASSIPSTRFATCPTESVTNPGCPLDIADDYGRASFDVRHRIFFGGSVGMPYGFRVSPFIVASSGVPFNITAGQDIYGDAVFNTRPAFATCPTASTPTVVKTIYGCFNLSPQPGQPLIPINDATSPSRFTLNLRLSKTFGFGQKKEATATGPTGPGGGTFGRPTRGGGGRGGGRGGFFDAASNSRYNLTFSVNARNLLNNVNLGTPIGNLSSPLFGQANTSALGPFNTSAANRRIDLLMSFSF